MYVLIYGQMILIGRACTLFSFKLLNSFKLLIDNAIQSLYRKCFTNLISGYLSLHTRSNLIILLAMGF